jgi:uncharacterized protein
MSRHLLRALCLATALAAGTPTAFAAASASPLPQSESEWKAYFKELDRGKDAQAYFLLGTYYAAGHPQLTRSGKPDPDKAFDHYEKAAELGHPEAQYRVGYCFENKLGVRRANLETAQKWYLKAADQEVPAAQLRVGQLFFDEKGAFYNRQQAYHYLSKAAERGLPEAQRMLGDCYKLGWGTARDYVKALTWYIIASAQEDEKAKNSRDTVVEIYHLTKEEVRAAEKGAREFQPKP